jgi:hypothetical protein
MNDSIPVENAAMLFDSSSLKDLQGSAMHQTQRPPRVSYDAVVEIGWGSTIIHARVKDMSITGLFLEIAQPLWIGATFAAKMILQPPIQMTCKVIRIVPNRGMGVEITSMASEDSKRFSRLLNALGLRV